MELTSSLESERHANRDIGQKLSDTSMELAETQKMVCSYDLRSSVAINLVPRAFSHFPAVPITKRGMALGTRLALQYQITPDEETRRALHRRGFRVCP